MNISRPNMKYQLIAKDIHNDDKTDPGACLNAPRLANGGIYLYASPFYPTPVYLYTSPCFPTPIYPSPCRPTPIYLCASSCWPKQRLPHSSRNTRQRPPTTHPRLTPADAPFQTSGNMDTRTRRRHPVQRLGWRIRGIICGLVVLSAIMFIPSFLTYKSVMTPEPHVNLTPAEPRAKREGRVFNGADLIKISTTNLACDPMCRNQV
ncbi:unnamed protein product [Boreogadus saida]